MVPLADYQKLESEVQALKQRLAWFERLMFGRKSERFVPAEAPQGQLKMSFEGEQGDVVAPSVRQLIESHERRLPPKKENAHRGRLPIPAHLQRVDEIIEPPEDVSGMKRIGEDITEVMEYEPGRVWVRRIIRPKYARPEATLQEGQGQIVQAPAKELPFGRSKAGVSLITHILISKYVEHLPLHRLIARFARSGLKIPPATIGHWVKVGADPLLILYEVYQQLVFSSFYLQMDSLPRTQSVGETTLRVLEEGKGKTHLGYLWAVFDPVHKLPFFFYQKGLNRWGNMTLMFVDGRLEIDNNLVENIIRPAAIGRKNHLFAGSHSLPRTEGRGGGSAYRHVLYLLRRLQTPEHRSGKMAHRCAQPHP